jgi:hypothetical protein
MSEPDRTTDIKPPAPASEPFDESEFATFENPDTESVGYHLRHHWPDLRIARVGDRAAETQDVVVACGRCEVRYLLEDLPSRRLPGTEAFDRPRS